MKKSHWLLALVACGVAAGTWLASVPTPAEPTRARELNARAEVEKPFETGYQLGYDLGFNQGYEIRQQAQAYEPTVQAERMKTWTSDRVRAGYQAGFFAGYQDGYHSQTDNDAPASRHFNTGYTDGYRVGLNQGNLCRQQQCAYNPAPTVDRPAPAEYDSGYRVGYWQGFERGYTYWERSQSAN